MKKTIILVFILLLTSSCSNNSQEIKSITTSEVYNNITSGKYVIIDVRDSEEYADGHIQNAINIPVNDIENYVEKIILNKNFNIVVYCRSGARSLTASHKLKKLGYSNIYDMGGIINWNYDLIK